MLKELIPSITQNLTVFANIVLILLLLLLIFKPKMFENELTFLYKHARLFALIVAVAALLGSLGYSEILGYNPCKLCWIQRIFMFPLTIILGIAYFTKDKGIEKYVISLATLGGIVSLYQYYAQRFNISTSCLPGEESCARIWEFAYGYITIPMMAASAFALIIVFSYMAFRYRQKNNKKR